MIVVYKTIPAETIRMDATDSIPKLVKWFKDHPDRKDCHIALWYGQQFTLKRGSRVAIAKAVHAAAEAAINHK